MKPSFTKPFAKKGIPDIPILHNTSAFVLFSENGLNVTTLLPITGPLVISMLKQNLEY
jgi:hypothetical protein